MVHLVHDEVSVVIDVSGGVPTIAHWGARLDAPDAQRLASMTRRPTTHGSLDVVPDLQIVNWAPQPKRCESAVKN